MENIVPNINPENSTYAPNHMGANISSVMASYPVMLSPHLLSSFGTVYVLPDLSPPRDMTSGLQFPEMNEMGGMLPFASNFGLWDYTNIVMNFLCGPKPSDGSNSSFDWLREAFTLVESTQLRLYWMNIWNLRIKIPKKGTTDLSKKHLIKDDHLLEVSTA
ncbi:hypothetical protein K7X08_035927 [Anisodus acutangulus]|uniref:Uncharacterized protein n=1 Tax=Anisodus acutangulus TaxID=402998 RepID=A0A9Q1QXK5_9SOLA|nr:hypothetical protein K7X08_035927 [Anisodus acutangulus]